jgi:hypothetical protein
VVPGEADRARKPAASAGVGPSPLNSPADCVEGWRAQCAADTLRESLYSFPTAELYAFPGPPLAARPVTSIISSDGTAGSSMAYDSMTKPHCWSKSEMVSLDQ